MRESSVVVGDTKEVEVKAGTVYIKELSAPKGSTLDSTVRALNVEVGKTATLTVADTPKVTETLIYLKSTWKQENPLHKEMLL